MSKLGNFFKKVGNTLGDAGKGLLKVALSPVNSLTGHEYNPNMKTKFGNAFEKGADFLEDVQGSAVNTASLGLAKKIGIADGERETKAGVVAGSIAGVAGLAAGAVALAGAALPAGATGAAKLGVVSSTASILKPRNNEMISSSHMKNLQDSLGVATLANVRPPDFSDLTTRQLTVDNTTQPKSVLDRALGSVQSLFDSNTKAGSVLDSIFGKRTATTSVRPVGSSDYNSILFIVGGLLLVLFLFKK